MIFVLLFDGITTNGKVDKYLILYKLLVNHYWFGGKFSSLMLFRVKIRYIAISNG
jgi:hypothetical protein